MMVKRKLDGAVDRSCFVKETAPKCCCLVDFFAINLPTMRAYTHVHPRFLFITGRKSTC